MVKSKKSNNLGLALLFVSFVVGLVILSFFVKAIFFLKETKFDGQHEFNIEARSKDSLEIISFSPPTKSISILNVPTNTKNETSKELEVPIDGQIFVSNQITKKNISSNFFKLLLPFGNSYKNLNYIDIMRIFLYSRGVLSSSIYYREILSDLNQQQKSTLISLTFTDPTIYQENKSIEIVNATDTYGLGTRLANLVTNIGGNVILITSPQTINNKSQILYFGDKSYTVERLSKILKYPLIKTDKKSISDVIIIIGKDNRGEF